MDTTHHTKRPPSDPDTGHEAAVRWLARQLRWEHLLTELRGAHDEDGATTR